MGMASPMKTKASASITISKRRLKMRENTKASEFTGAINVND
jgi:hypothetical protein